MNLTIFQYAKSNPRVGLKLDNAKKWEKPTLPQVVLLLKMPCDSTSWTGTQAANHSWPLALAKSWKGFPKRLNALMSRVLRAASLMLSESISIQKKFYKKSLQPKLKGASVWPFNPCNRDYRPSLSHMIIRELYCKQKIYQSTGSDK